MLILSLFKLKCNITSTNLARIKIMHQEKKVLRLREVQKGEKGGLKKVGFCKKVPRLKRLPF